MKKILLLILLVTSKMFSFAQDSYKKERSTLSVILRAGLPRGDTKESYKAMYSFGLRREFSIGKFVSLNATTSYNTSVPKQATSNMNLVNVGGGITLYPKYLINKILGDTYDEEIAKADNFYIDQSYEININKSGLYGVGNVFTYRSEVNAYAFHLGKKLTLNAKGGGVLYIPTNDSNLHKETIFGYLYLGLGLNFKR